MCFDAVYVNLALEPTAALAALDVALELDGDWKMAADGGKIQLGKSGEKIGYQWISPW